MSKLFKLKNGTNFLLTEAPGGIYNSAQLKKIAELCDDDIAIVKATEDQRLGLFVKDDDVDSVREKLVESGLGVRNYQDGLHQAVACLGELCEEHDQDALGTAMDLTQSLEDLTLNSGIRIGVNGCFQCCTPCHTLDIALVGEPGGYRLSLGGKGSQVPEFAAFMAEHIPADKVSGLVRGVVELYQKKAEEGESLHDVLERCGVSDFVKALAPYSQDAHDGGDFLAENTSIDLTEQSSEGDDIEDVDDDDLDLLEHDHDEQGGEIDLGENSAEDIDDLNDLDDDGLDDIDDSGLELDEVADDLDMSELEDGEAEISELEEASSEMAELDDADLSELDDQNSDMVGLDDSDSEAVSENQELVTASGELDDDLDAMDDDLSDLEEEAGELSELETDDLDAEIDDLDSEIDADLNVGDADDSSLEELEANDLEASGEIDLDTIDSEPSLDELEDTKLDSDPEVGLDLEDNLQPEPEVEVPSEVAAEDDIDLDFGDKKEIEVDDSDLDLELDEDVSEFKEEKPTAAQAEETDIDSISADDVFGSDESATTEPAIKPVSAIAKDKEPAAPEFNDVSELSEADEENFESKIIADIDEESSILATSEVDQNLEDRENTLELLADDEFEEEIALESESMGDMEDELDDLNLDDIDLDDLDEDIQITPEDYRTPVQELPSKQSHSSKGSDLKFSGLNVTGDRVHLSFHSGAFIDIELENLGEPKSFTFGGQQFNISRVEEGIYIEVDGVKMFYPINSLPAVS